MKKVNLFCICLVAFWSFCKAQNDTMYVVKNGVAIGQYAIADIDSLVFEKPSLLLTTGNGVIDADGNNYGTAIIGTQEWMTENLRTSKFSNGDAITNVTDDSQWASTTNPAYARYQLNASPVADIHGDLYNWYAVTDARNICPSSWHVPTLSEWETLITYIGGIGNVRSILMSDNPDFYNGGTSITWDNSSHLALSPSGFREDEFGMFSLIYTTGFYWSATDQSLNSARNLAISVQGPSEFQLTRKKTGMSVRCIKD